MKTRSLQTVAICLIGLAMASPLQAHEGGHHDGSHAHTDSRTWSIAAEGSHLHGSFVASRNGQVQIRRDDGKLCKIAMDRLIESDQEWVENRMHEIAVLNRQHAEQMMVIRHMAKASLQTSKTHSSTPLMAEHFKPFEKLLQIRWDKNFLYVGSNGLPEHPMMVGIRSWQQQVPIPQKYLGNNAWRIPLHPVPAKNPMSTKNNFLRGAIALAVNGVPIFNPLNNRGDDAYLFGELDEYGGHCGRGDDYHYHIAPVHLEETSGKGKPIGYALDGYPILGYQDQQAADFSPLDKLGGHKDASGNYHYHAQKTYPYVNAGFYGEVTQRGGQVDPQPRAEPIRPDLRPLRNAKITGFSKTGNQFELEYDVSGRKGTVAYVVKDDSTVDFTFQAPSGTTRKETFRSRMGKPFLPQSDITNDGSPPDENQASGLPAANGLPTLNVYSSAFEAGDELPVEFTGDGAGESPPISWTKGPPETQSYAVDLWHTPGPGETKSYWLLYDIPADVTSLPKQVSGIGTAGQNDKGHANYDPMRSKGPGAKQYHLTVYALSERPKLVDNKVTREDLLHSISEITLAEGTLDFQYTRSLSRSSLVLIALTVVSLASFFWIYMKRFRNQNGTVGADSGLAKT
ncbi:MAG: YHYH protein [Fuerstiella sp.]